MSSIQDQLKGYEQLNQMQVTAIQSESQTTLDFTQGSVNLAYIQSNSGVALSLESLAVFLYAYARASTLVNPDPSIINPDLDTWIGQFSQSPTDQFNRLKAVSASGNVTFSRYTTTQQAVIPVNTQVETSIGNIIFTVIEDDTNPAWSSSLNGYIIPVGTDSISVPVQAVTAGTAGNVASNQINMIVQGIPYVNNVTNSTAFINGKDIESDAAFLSRFQLIINSLSKGTYAAVAAAIESAQDGILYAIWPNINHALGYQPGFVTIVIDDGSGTPPSSLITAVKNAVNDTIALGITFDVYATVPITKNISATLLVDPTYDQDLIQSAVNDALTNYINNLDVGMPLYYSKLPDVFYGASKGILNVNNLLVGGGIGDIIPTGIQSVKVGTITLTFATPS